MTARQLIDKLTTVIRNNSDAEVKIYGEYGDVWGIGDVWFDDDYGEGVIAIDTTDRDEDEP